MSSTTVTSVTTPLTGSLREVQAHFMRLYGDRNLFVNGPTSERVQQMIRRHGRIADSERKNEKMAERLAKAVNYFMSLVNYFGGRVDLARGMATKFPSGGCVYCGCMPCECKPGSRPEPRVGPIDERQLLWNIRDWQSHLFGVYGEANLERGFWEVYGRTTSEFGELSILNTLSPKRPSRAAEIIHECELESADFFSWIVAMAYVKGVDLQVEVVRYYSVCPGCRQCPCDCPIVPQLPNDVSFSGVRHDSGEQVEA